MLGLKGNIYQWREGRLQGTPGGFVGPPENELASDSVSKDAFLYYMPKKIRP